MKIHIIDRIFGSQLDSVLRLSSISWSGVAKIVVTFKKIYLNGIVDGMKLTNFSLRIQ